MSIESQVEAKLSQAFHPSHLSLNNDDHKHAPGSGLHLSLVIAANCFSGKTAVERHQMIYRLLSIEMKQSIHALSIQAYTPDEWTGQTSNTPPCQHKQET